MALDNANPDPVSLRVYVTNEDPIEIDGEVSVSSIDSTVEVEGEVSVSSIDSTVQTNETLYTSWTAYAEQVSAQNVTGEQLTTHATTGGFTVVSSTDNSGMVYLGHAANACHVPLPAGSAMSFSLPDTDLVFFRTETTGDGVVVFGWTV